MYNESQTSSCTDTTAPTDADSDFPTMLFIILGFTFVFYVTYRIWNVAGSVSYFILSLGIVIQDGTIFKIMGLIMILFSVINMIFILLFGLVSSKQGVDT